MQKLIAVSRPASPLVERPLSRVLILRLSATVLLVSALLSTVYYLFSEGQITRDFANRRQQLDEEIATVLQSPLFNMDRKQTEQVATAFLSGNEVLTGIRIESDQGMVYFNHPPVAPVTLTSSIVVRAHEMKVGSLTLYFSDHAMRAKQRTVLILVFALTLALLLVLIVFIRFFLYRHLDKPIASLIQGIRRISAGDVDAALPAVPQEELAVISREVNAMAASIGLKNRELRQSEQKYHSIFDGAMEGIFQATIEGKLLTANPALASILGYSSVGKLLQDAKDLARSFYVDPGARDELIGLLREKGAVKDFQAQLRRLDGAIIQVMMNVRLVQEESGAAPYLEGIMSDISRQKELEANLRQAQKLEAIGTLAGGIAHDFNNILAAVFGYCELAIYRSQKEQDVSQELTNILRAAERARDLVRQILAFSRKSQQKIVPVQLAIILKEVLKLLSATLPATIQLAQDIRSSAMVLSDPTLVHQVIMNLCTNAYQAMREKGGTLSVMLSDMVVEQTSTQSCLPPDLKPGPYLLLEVSDTGCGMDQVTMSKIYEPYFTTKEKENGTGLGLATVHGIVRESGGAIQVSSQPGVGTTFLVYFPACEENVDVVTQQAVSANETPLGKGERVLLVDDEEMIRSAFTVFLNDLGYQVVAVGHPQEALSLFQEKPEVWDLLISDMTMPELTGVDLVTVILGLRPNLPIILCTGFSEQLMYEQAQALGVKTVLQKPFSGETLARTIRTLLDS